MATNTCIYQQLNPKSKINEQADPKHNCRYRECFNGCQMEGELGQCAKKVKGLRSTNWLLQNSHWDVKYGIGNIVNNNLIL